MIGKILCWFGYHKVDETKWTEKEIWGDETFETNCCKRCEEFTYKYNGKRRNFRKILRKLR